MPKIPAECGWSSILHNSSERPKRKYNPIRDGTFGEKSNHRRCVICKKEGRMSMPSCWNWIKAPSVIITENKRSLKMPVNIDGNVTLFYSKGHMPLTTKSYISLPRYPINAIDHLYLGFIRLFVGIIARSRHLQDWTDHHYVHRCFSLTLFQGKQCLDRRRWM